MKGFTLIELLIILTIVGLLFSFGFVNFRDYSRRQHLAGVATNIRGDLRLAQGKALAGEKPGGCINLTAYDFKMASSSYRVVANCDNDIDVKTVDLPSDITAVTILPTISFKVLGEGTNIPQGTEARIVLTQTATGQTATITVTSGGEIK